jgi:hypothetical protein
MGFFGGGGAAPANMGGATSSAAGTAGLVPAPAAGEQGSILFGDADFKKYIMPAGGSYGTDYVGFPYIDFQAWNTANLNVNSNLLMRGRMFYLAGTYNRIACYVGTGSSGKNIKAGIYDIDTNGYETSLVASGTISLASTGVAEVAVSDFTLESKFYICAWIIDSSGASIWYGSTGYMGGRPFSNFDASNNPNLNSSISHTGAYISRNYSDGLPSALATTGYTGYNPSLLWVRKV